LPCLVGPVIAVVEDIVGPHLQPLASSVENRGIYYLSLADEQLFAIGGVVEKNVPLVPTLVKNAKGFHSYLEQAATKLFTAYGRVRGRGVIGAAADTWVDYESLVKSKSVRALKLAENIPLLNVLVPIFQAVGAPVGLAVSDWLVKRSEIHDKHLVLQEGCLLPNENVSKVGEDEKHLLVIHSEAEFHSSMNHQDRGEDEKHLFVANTAAVDNHPSVNSQGTGNQEINAVDDQQQMPSQASSEGPKESASLDAVEPQKAAFIQGAGTSTAKIVVHHADSDEDSDDELSALFHAGWSIGKVAAAQVAAKKITTHAKKSHGK